MAQRSKTVPAEVFIGDAPKRPRGPPNAAQLKRRQAREQATKRPASVPAQDVRVRMRGGPADAQRAAVKQKLADNAQLYEDKSGNIKSKRPRAAKAVDKSSSAKAEVKTPQTVRSKTYGKSKQSGPEIRSDRPEDRYGVRQRRAKSVASRSREPLGLVV